jgi:hypothetical protein
MNGAMVQVPASQLKDLHRSAQGMLDLLARTPVMPIIWIHEADTAVGVARALVEGGVTYAAEFDGERTVAEGPVPVRKQVRRAALPAMRTCRRSAPAPRRSGCWLFGRRRPARWGSLGGEARHLRVALPIRTS